MMAEEEMHCDFSVFCPLVRCMYNELLFRDRSVWKQRNYKS